MQDVHAYLAQERQLKLIALMKKLFFAAPFLLLLPPIWEKLTNPWNFWQFVQEDGPVEWTTAAIYLLAVPIAAILAIRFRKAGLALHALLIAGLGAVMFFVGMEEISWAQRVLGIETPQNFAAANLQAETNLHNLLTPNTLQTGIILVGLYGMFASFFMPALLKPVFGSQARGLASLVSPPGFLKSYFFLTFFIQMMFVLSPLLVDLFGPQWGYAHKPDAGFFMIGRDREYGEMITALGFFLFTCWLLFLQSSGEWYAITQPDRAAEPTQEQLPEDPLAGPRPAAK